MAHWVYARKYRPQSFAEVIGQEAIVRILTHAIQQNQIGQAYLFAGPRGTGKTSVARIFAKSLNCKEGPTPQPCQRCPSCIEITEGRSMDVLEIDGASTGKVEDIRQLRQTARFAPAYGQYKIYLIDEVHQVSSDGFDALLKLLEEPPPRLIFILATTAPHKVPATIASRCQRFDFKRLPTRLIVEKLKRIAQLEGLKVSPEALIGIARAADGSVRDAESMLDQVVAYGAKEITADVVWAVLGGLDEDRFSDLLLAIRKRDPMRALAIVAGALEDGADLCEWTSDLLTYLRHVMVAKVGTSALGFEDLGESSIERIRQLAQEFSVGELIQMAQVLADAFRMMRGKGVAQPRIPLETALIHLATTEPLLSIDRVIERLEELSDRLQPADSSHPQKTLPTDLDRVRSVWPSLIERIQKIKVSVATCLSEGQPIRFQAGDPAELAIGFPKEKEFHVQILNQPNNRKLVSDALSELLGCPVRCHFCVDPHLSQDASQNPSSGGSASADPPLLNSILEMFDGRLIQRANS